jgi:hypothetical protein
MQTLNMNGRTRKSLADQIDKLERLLDGLAEGLNEAVAAAVQEAVSQVLTQLLAAPELQARLQAAVPPAMPATPTPTVLARVRAACQRVGTLISDRVRALGRNVQVLATRVKLSCHQCWVRCTATCVHFARNVRGWFLTGWLLLHGARHLAGFVAAALAVGTAAGMGAYLLGPTIAAAISGTSGFVGALALQVSLWLRQAFLDWAGER